MTQGSKLQKGPKSLGKRYRLNEGVQASGHPDLLLSRWRTVTILRQGAEWEKNGLPLALHSEGVTLLWEQWLEAI